ncbi:addiction module toxin RelE [Raoultella sp. X13]|nr:addiction module toxin RelE [Raoultella sp. X13]
MYTKSFGLHQGGKCANPRELTPVNDRVSKRKQRRDSLVR